MTLVIKPFCWVPRGDRQSQGSTAELFQVYQECNFLLMLCSVKVKITNSVIRKKILQKFFSFSP